MEHPSTYCNCLSDKACTSPIAFPYDQEKMERDETRLYRWLLLSLLLHCTLSFLFMMMPQERFVHSEPTVIFDADEPSTRMLDNSTPAPLPGQPGSQPAIQSDPEEVQFDVQQNQSSKFGAPELEAEQFSPSTGEGENPQPEAKDPNDSTASEALPQTPTINEQPQQIEEKAAEPINDPSPRELSATALLEQQSPASGKRDSQENPQDVKKESEPIADASHKAEKSKSPFEFSGSKSRGPITKNLSLAKLTEGFLDFVKDRGTNETITLQSNDVRYASYFQKVGWFLQNSFHLHNRPITIDHSVRETIDLHMVIEKSGALSSCTIKQPCSAPAINNLLRKIVEAASPFPPLPAHLKRDRLSVNIPIYIDAHPGTNLYHFTFRG